MSLFHCTAAGGSSSLLPSFCLHSSRHLCTNWAERIPPTERAHGLDHSEWQPCCIHQPLCVAQRSHQSWSGIAAHIRSITGPAPSTTSTQSNISDSCCRPNTAQASGTGDRQDIPNLVDIVHCGPAGRTVRLGPLDELLRSFSEAGGQDFGENLVASRFKRASPFQTFFFFYGFFPRWTCELNGHRKRSIWRVWSAPVRSLFHSLCLHSYRHKQN